MEWEAGCGIASLYRNACAESLWAQRGGSKEEEGIKFSQAFRERTVIYLCPVETCLYVSAPVGPDDHWPLEGVRCGLPREPRTAESIFGARYGWKTFFSELLQLSGYRSKKRLGELLLSISYFYNAGCMWRITADEWVRRNHNERRWPAGVKKCFFFWFKEYTKLP